MSAKGEQLRVQIQARRAATVEREQIEERMVNNLVALTMRGRRTPELHEAAAEERTPGVREILEEARRIELQGGRGGSS